MTNAINKRLIHATIFLFLGVVLVAVLIHSIAFDLGFHANWSISRYMGTDHWSAILFAVVNFIIIAIFLRYFLQLRKAYHLSPFWLIGAIIMLIAYFGLSCFPVGLFDAIWGQFGTISTLHHVFSYTLFITMAIIAVDTIIELKKSPALTTYGILMLAYAAFCIFSYVNKMDFFYANIFFFETGYIVANLIFYNLIPQKA